MTTEPKPASTPYVTTMLIINALLIVIFAIIGVASHDGNLGISNIARVAIPFLLPYLILAAAIKPTKLINNIFPAGLALWLITVVLGPILRSMLFSDTSALAFILVAAGVLAVFILGRRSISTLLTRQRKTA